MCCTPTAWSRITAPRSRAHRPSACSTGRSTNSSTSISFSAESASARPERARADWSEPVADNAADPKQPAAEARPGDAGKPALDDESRARYRLYLGLLACALLVAFAVAAVPALRNRLAGRVQALRQAMGWESVETERAVALVGENKYEFPAELVRPAPKFSSAGVLALPGSMVFRPRGEGSARAAPEASGEPAPREEEASGEKRAPEFRQGAAEKEAFDLLLKSHEGMAALVRGSNSSLQGRHPFVRLDRKSTRLNSSHSQISYAVFC